MADHAHNLRARSWTSDGPIGVPTRGTTGFNRLRKSDRWTAAHPLVFRQFQRAVVHEQRRPVAVDVGYGASFTTTVEWARFLRGVHPAAAAGGAFPVAVTGVEIEPSRVLPPRDGVEFALGGFECGGRKADLIRAFNVLRQYDVDQVEAAWATMRAQLYPGGLIVEGTCDELGRRASWVLLDEVGPRSLTLAWDARDVQRPSDVAERLPKMLIHRNVPGERVFAWLRALDAAWDRAAPLAVFGPRVRWREAQRELLLGASSLFADLSVDAPLVSSDAVPLDFPSFQRLLAAGLARRRLQDCVITVPWSFVL